MRLETPAEVNAAMKASDEMIAGWSLPKYHDEVIQAETIVLDCLRALRAIPDADRVYADELMDGIAELYMKIRQDIPTQRRRGFALLGFASEVAE